jgi:hypothetical protein
MPAMITLYCIRASKNSKLVMFSGSIEQDHFPHVSTDYGRHQDARFLLIPFNFALPFFEIAHLA